jgi:uncharacterized protein YdhG (YjbR/CyaY superfamily)
MRQGDGSGAGDGAAESARVEERIASMPAAMHDALQGLRRAIAAAAPAAVEGISYALPAFRYRGRPLVSYGATSRHCALYVMSPAVIEAHASELAGYDTSKGTVRFAPHEPLPDDLVTKLVHARIAEIDAAAGRARPGG